MAERAAAAVRAAGKIKLGTVPGAEKVKPGAVTCAAAGALAGGGAVVPAAEGVEVAVRGAEGLGLKWGNLGAVLGLAKVFPGVLARADADAEVDAEV